MGPFAAFCKLFFGSSRGGLSLDLYGFVLVHGKIFSS
uniref:Uncharacterized protein n=1 Tax=Fagus sylvatica TaxID=28930 RepID=A0A2N9IN27_FAGSY